MKKIILLILIVNSLISCNSDIKVRVKTLKNNDIIVITGQEDVFSGYQVGDTIQITKKTVLPWEFKNDSRIKDQRRSFNYKNEDSTIVSSWIDYKQAIIQEIDCKSKN